MKARVSSAAMEIDPESLSHSQSPINASASQHDSKSGGKGSPSTMTRSLKMLFCFLGLQVSYVLWGLFQEQLMTKEYKLGKFKSSTFCVFGNRFLALFIAAGIVLVKRLYAKGVSKEPSYHVYAPSSISNSVSSWAQYESLKYISFPTQVLSKSCKIVPVMIVGIFVNRKSYSLLEYLDAFLITTGVAMFSFSEKNGGGGDGGGHAHGHGGLAAAERSDSSYGMLLLCVYLICDSFTSQWQSRVYKQHGVDQYQMMLGVNIWSMLLTGVTLYFSGEGTESMQFMMADLSALSDSVVLSVTSAMGQLFIFYTVKEFGPVVFTIMMTTRQIFSLFLSCLLFSHPMHLLGWIGASVVFLVVFNRIRRGERE